MDGSNITCVDICVILASLIKEWSTNIHSNMENHEIIMLYTRCQTQKAAKYIIQFRWKFNTGKCTGMQGRLMVGRAKETGGMGLYITRKNLEMSLQKNVKQLIPMPKGQTTTNLVLVQVSVCYLVCWIHKAWPHFFSFFKLFTTWMFRLEIKSLS